ncbi:hypothetical protein V2J09_019968 [Rumex salicifolius]
MFESSTHFSGRVELEKKTHLALRKIGIFIGEKKMRSLLNAKSRVLVGQLPKKPKGIIKGMANKCCSKTLYLFTRNTNTNCDELSTNYSFFFIFLQNLH